MVGGTGVGSGRVGGIWYVDGIWGGKFVDGKGVSGIKKVLGMFRCVGLSVCL